MAEQTASEARWPKRTTKGVYALIIEVGRPQLVKVGRLGPREMPSGLHVYVGSAMGGGSQSLQGRIRRHLSAEKSPRWHIDFVLAAPSVAVRSVVFAEASRRLECQLTGKLRSIPSVRMPVPRLGASDCRERCGSHLLLFPDLGLEKVERKAVEAFKALGLSPMTLRP
ncbi:MAG: GIY-YIG nuclease family protein [Candidatus Bathyarchaeia archaeon]